MHERNDRNDDLSKRGQGEEPGTRSYASPLHVRFDHLGLRREHIYVLLSMAYEAPGRAPFRARNLQERPEPNDSCRLSRIFDPRCQLCLTPSDIHGSFFWLRRRGRLWFWAG